MKTPNENEHAEGRSVLSAGLCLLQGLQKMREETAATCDDIALSDGTIMLTKEHGLALVAKYDELIGAIKHQCGVVAVDPKYPSYCCEPRSCDQRAQ